MRDSQISQRTISWRVLHPSSRGALEVGGGEAPAKKIDARVAEHSPMERMLVQAPTTFLISLSFSMSRSFLMSKSYSISMFYLMMSFLRSMSFSMSMSFFLEYWVCPFLWIEYVLVVEYVLFKANLHFSLSGEEKNKKYRIGLGFLQGQPTTLNDCTSLNTTYGRQVMTDDCHFG